MNEKWSIRLGLMLILMILLSQHPLTGYGQIIPERYGNNPTNISWRQLQTPHFNIVFPNGEQAVAQTLAGQSEAVFREYRQKLGTAPSRKITLYYNKHDRIVSDIHARHIDNKFSIWLGKPSTLPESFYGRRLNTKLRREIAYAFQENTKYFPIDYYYYLFSRPSKSPWSNGLVSYLAAPDRRSSDLRVERQYGYLQQHNKKIAPPDVDAANRMLGRSQLQYFSRKFSSDSLQAIYSTRQHILGIPYFDLNPAFKKATGIDYHTFSKQWKRDLPRISLTKRTTNLSPEKTISQLTKPDDAHRYVGGAISASDSLIAVIVQPESGKFAEELQIRRWNQKSKKQYSSVIAKGHFCPQVDWSARQNMLAFAKRNYNRADGSYYYQIRLWRAAKDQTKNISGRVDAGFPTFSGDGKRLAYVERKQLTNDVMVQNLQTGSRRKVYSFKKSQVITHLDFRSKGDLILVSYRRQGAYRAGTLNINMHRFTPFALRYDVPVQAAWGPDSNMLYFDKSFKGVPNIFKAQLAGEKISAAKRLSSQPFGAYLWNVAGGSHKNGAIILAANEHADFSNQMTIYGATGAISLHDKDDNKTNIKADRSSTAVSRKLKTKKLASVSGGSQSYHPAGNIRWEQPFAVPYVYGGDYGLGGYVSLQEPLRTHEFNYYGTLSLNDPLHKSYFYSEYINNMFCPRLKLAYNHLPAASGFFGPKRKEAKTVDAVALSSLWKITGWSHDYSDWYAGLMLRYLAFDYFSRSTLRKHHQTIFFKNTKTRQTDLRASLAWRLLEPGRNTLIHPLEGDGVRFSITASDKILGSQSRYARFNLDAYTILPGIGKDRIYVYGNGVIDAGAPAGRDYLNFSENGDYQLPSPNFTGNVNPGINRFVRGYTKPLLGDRFLYGRIEYRMPFEFNTHRKLFGLIPPARTSFTFFSDGGVMGNARTAVNVRETKYRYSFGAEIKRVFTFGGNFAVTYELGIAQPLTKSFGPTPFFNVKSALPF